MADLDMVLVGYDDIGMDRLVVRIKEVVLV